MTLRPGRNRRSDPTLRPVTGEAPYTVAERRFARRLRTLLHDAATRITADVVFEHTPAELAARVQLDTVDVVDLYREAIETAAQAEVDEFLQPVQKQEQVEVQTDRLEEFRASLTFSASLEESAIWAEANAGRLVRDISTSQAQSISAIAARANRDGLTRREVSRLIREAGVGLHERWTVAVLNRRVADARNLARRHPGWSPARLAQELDHTTAKYSEKLLRSRTRMIARTELISANNMGKLASWNSAADQGLYDTSVAVKEWRTGPTSLSGISPCDVCVPMHGTQTKVNEMFFTRLGPIIAPPAHPSCRCTHVLLPRGPVAT